VNIERWERLMADLHIPEERETYASLEAAYAEPHRYYHTAQHIDHCLAEFDLARNLAVEPAEVEVALWFHDAIYKPHRSDNEQASADWAERFLATHSVDPARIGRIRAHILATRHASPAASADAQLVLDVDLAILGTDRETYWKFEESIRKEYRWVPGPLFRSKRTEILRSFLERPFIYSTLLLRDRLEATARSNLAAAIEALRS
jgi:predicted metal-dependent HD superfamily phosphohydrolase